MRIDKLLSNLKYGTRTEIKKMIKNKLVMVNNEIIKDSGMNIDPVSDLITVSGTEVQYRKYIYLMLNKPQGYISATFDNYHKTVIDLLSEAYLNFNLFPVGRLDIDTEGLLILSNDGQFAHRLMHPKKSIYKTYYVEVDDDLSESDISAFYEGLEIYDGNNKLYKTKKAYLEILDKQKGYVSISEGKFHQVKRMFNKVDKNVTYLKRTQIGKLQLDETLKLGSYKELTNDDIDKLFVSIE